MKILKTLKVDRKKKLVRLDINRKTLQKKNKQDLLMKKRLLMILQQSNNAAVHDNEMLLLKCEELKYEEAELLTIEKAMLIY